MSEIQIRAGEGSWSSATPRVFTLGRDESSDITSLDPSVSRRHAEIRPAGDGWEIVDLDSSHGTYLDGQRVQRAALTGTCTVGLGSRGEALTLTITVAGASPQTQVAGPGGPAVAPPPFQAPPPAGPAAAAPPPFQPSPPAPTPPATPAVDRLAGGGNVPPPMLGQTVVAGGAGQGGGPGLLIRRRNGSDLRFPFGIPVRIGRDPQFEVVADDPAVSRLHAVVEPRQDGWWWVDRSTSGSFVEGERITQLKLTEPVEISMGHPTAGHEIEVVPVVAPQQAAAAIQGKKRRKTLAVVGAALAVILIVGAVGLFAFVLGDQDDDPEPSAGGDPSSQPVSTDGELTEDELNRAKLATVLLIAYDDTDTPLWSGSGSVIDESGLVLTNAHVGAPNSPGQGASSPEPAYLTVSLTSEDDAAPAQAKYRANPVVSDGYLDMAILQINADADGNPVAPDELELPEPLPIGDSDDVRTGDRIIALGYPAIGNILADGDRPLTVTEGVVSTFQADPIIGTDRGAIDSDVRLGSGNSGGPSINEDGEIIGLNTRVVTADSMNAGAITQGSALIVPVNLADAILDIADEGGDPSYVSPYVQEMTDVDPSEVSVEAAGWSYEEDAGACDGTDLGGAPDSLPAAPGDYVGAEFVAAGVPDGAAVTIEFYTLDGTRLDSLTDTWDLGTSEQCVGAGLEIPEGVTGAVALFYVGDSSSPVAENAVDFS